MSSTQASFFIRRVYEALCGVSCAGWEAGSEVRSHMLGLQGDVMVFAFPWYDSDCASLLVRVEFGAGWSC